MGYVIYVIVSLLFGGSIVYITYTQINLKTYDAVTMPNIGYLFMGYDVMYGNPLQVSGLPVDPGFREPVLHASYSSGSTTADQRYLIPDGTSIIDCSGSCTFNFGSFRMSGAKSYQKSLERKVWGWASGTWPASFSASVDYKKVARSTSNFSYLYTHSDASCCSYLARLLTFVPPKLSENFRAALGTLTEEYDKDIYLTVIRTFGTHYVSRALMGALFGQQSKVSTSAWNTMVRNGLHILAGSKLSAFKQTASANWLSDDQRRIAEEFSSKSTEQLIYSIGTVPPSDNNPLTWVKNIKSAPAPMTLTLTSIMKLLDDRHGVKVSDAVKANMQKALNEYCNYLYEQNEVASCITPGPDAPFPDPPLKRTWLDWSTQNRNGQLNNVKECSEGKYVTIMTWRQQTAHGFVDLGFSCSDGSSYRMTNNNNGFWNDAVRCDDDKLGFREIRVEKQTAYGIINSESYCFYDAAPQISNTNQNGIWYSPKSCGEGQHVVGVQTREQSYYGIVDFRFECARAKSDEIQSQKIIK